MGNLLLAFRVVVPLVIYMAAGGLIRKLKILEEEHFKRLNSMIFQTLIPLSLFFDVYASDLKMAFQPKLFGAAAVLILLLFGLSWAVVPRFIKEPPDAVVVVQGIYRSNYVLFGTAISAALCGEAGEAMTAALAVVVVPLFNVLAVILFESLRGRGARPAELVLHVFQNPLVDAGLLGALFNLLEIPLPDMLAAPLMTLGDIAAPLALLVLGGLLSFRSMVSHRTYLLSTVACRLILVPMIAMMVSVVLGFRGEALVALLAAFASPVSVSSAPMAQSMGGNGALAGEMVAVSSAGSVLTLFLFVLALSELGLL